MSEELHAVIGRKTVELESMHSEYNRLLSVLSQVVLGEIKPGRVSVDLQGRSWKLEAQTE